MDAPQISTLPQDSTPPPVESQYSLMGRFRLNNPPPPPDRAPSRSSKVRPEGTQEVYVIEDEEEDQLIDDDELLDDRSSAAKARGSGPVSALTNQGATPVSAIGKPRNKSNRRAASATSSVAAPSPTPRKGGRKSKTAIDTESQEGGEPWVSGDHSQAKPTMMAAWRVEVAPIQSGAGLALETPQVNLGPTEEIKPPRKRKRTSKAKEVTPGENVTIPPPQKRRTKTSKYIVKEEDGEFSSTFVYQGFPPPPEHEPLERADLASQPPPHRQAVRVPYESVEPTASVTHQLERDRDRELVPPVTTSSRPRLFHVERFTLPSSFLDENIEAIPADVLSAAPLRSVPFLVPDVKSIQLASWSGYNGPLDKAGKRCRRWTPLQREVKSISGVSWFSKAWIGGQETEVEWVKTATQPMVELPKPVTIVRPPEQAESSSVSSIGRGGGRGGRGGRGGTRGGRVAQDGSAPPKRVRNRPSKNSAQVTAMTTGITSTTTLLPPQPSQIPEPGADGDNGMADAALELEMMG